MDEIEIVKLKPEQWQEYKNLRILALKSDPDSFGTTLEAILKTPDKEWEKRLKEVQKGERRWMVFAKLNGKLVGMMQATIEGSKETAKVKAVFVAKEARGKGVGKKLLQNLVDQIKASGKAKKIQLGVYIPNDAAVNLYKSIGFKEVRIGKDTSLDGVVHERLMLAMDL